MADSLAGKYRLLVRMHHGAGFHERGTVVDLSPEDAARAVEQGTAKAVGAEDEDGAAFMTLEQFLATARREYPRYVEHERRRHDERKAAMAERDAEDARARAAEDAAAAERTAAEESAKAKSTVALTPAPVMAPAIAPDAPVQPAAPVAPQAESTPSNPRAEKKTK